MSEFNYDTESLLKSEESTEPQNESSSEREVGAQDQNFCITACDKIWAVIKGITIEPVMFLVIFSYSLQGALTTNMLLQKVCRINFNYTEDICNNLTNHTAEEDEVQQQVAQINMYMEVISNLPAVLFVLFLGSWSDRHGRKIPLILPFIGYFLATLIILFNSYYMELAPEYIIFSSVPRALTGGFITLLMAAYSYIADLSKLRSRTMRIAFMDIFMFLGAPVGLMCSNALYQQLGYTGIYGTSAALNLICIIYIMVRIQDTRGPLSPLTMESNETRDERRSMCKDLFNIDNVKSTVLVCVRERAARGRARLGLMMLAMCLMVFIFGSANLDFLYVKKKFDWGYDTYVKLGVVTLVCGSIGTSVLLPILSYKLGWNDSLLAMIGCFSKIAGLLLQGFAPHPWFLYLATCVACIGGIPTIVARSIISKIVPQCELGKVFSMLASLESVVPLLSNPFYTFLYDKTINIMPGSFYLISAGLYIIILVIYTFVYFWRVEQSAVEASSSNDEL